MLYSCQLCSFFGRWTVFFCTCFLCLQAVFLIDCWTHYFQKQNMAFLKNFTSSNCINRHLQAQYIHPRCHWVRKLPSVWHLCCHYPIIYPQFQPFYTIATILLILFLLIFIAAVVHLICTTFTDDDYSWHFTCEVPQTHSTVVLTTYWADSVQIEQELEIKKGFFHVPADAKISHSRWELSEWVIQPSAPLRQAETHELWLVCSCPVCYWDNQALYSHTASACLIKVSSTAERCSASCQT